jgi:hypothetical protein
MNWQRQDDTERDHRPKSNVFSAESSPGNEGIDFIRRHPPIERCVVSASGFTRHSDGGVLVTAIPAINTTLRSDPRSCSRPVVR